MSLYRHIKKKALCFAKQDENRYNYKSTYLLKSEMSGTQISSGRNCTRWKPPKLFLFQLRNSFVQVWKKHTNCKLQSRRYIRILRCQLWAAICKTVKDNSRTLYPNNLKTGRREWKTTSIGHLALLSPSKRAKLFPTCITQVSKITVCSLVSCEGKKKAVNKYVPWCQDVHFKNNVIQ